MVAVKFYYDVKKNNKKSLEAGRPVFEEALFCRFQNHNGEQEHEVNETFRQTFLVNRQPLNKDRQAEVDRLKEILDDFMRNGEKIEKGFPVKQWNMVSRTEAMELEDQGIVTLEMLSALGEKECKEKGIKLSLRDAAKEYLEYGATGGKSSSKIAALEESVRQKDQEIKDIKAELARANALIEALKDGDDKGKKGKKVE